VYGHKAETAFTAVFRLPRSRLPLIIAQQLVQASTGTVSLQATGGTFRVSGDAPFRSITWWTMDDDEARIKLKSRRDVEISDEYLAAGFAPLASGFRAFVTEQQGGSANE
jgi:hypothetical protein